MSKMLVFKPKTKTKRGISPGMRKLRERLNREMGEKGQKNISSREAIQLGMKFREAVNRDEGSDDGHFDEPWAT